IVAPLVFEAILMRAYQVPWSRVATVALETALSQAFWVALFMAAASLTPTLARFALLCSGAVVALVALIAASVALSMLRHTDSLPRGAASVEDPTGLVVLNVLIVIVLLLWAVVQYHTRSRVRSIVAGIAGV